MNARRAWPFVLALACGGGKPTASSKGPYADGLPYQYYLVGPHGAKTAGVASRELGPGFGVAVIDHRADVARTRQGELIAWRDLQPAHPTRFAGQAISGGRLDFGWVVERRAAVWSRPDAEGRVVATHEYFDRVALADEEAPPGWLRAQDGFVKASQLRVPRAAPRPGGVAATESWIDVDTDSETLVAYEGDRPVFATLVSTGIGAPGMPLSTPRGVFHVYAKAPTAKMDNLDHEHVPHYAFEDVPWVQFFNQEIALHGAFWHQRFGHPVSHGCVNLAPLDAQRLFSFADLKTVVRVR